MAQDTRSERQRNTDTAGGQNGDAGPERRGRITDRPMERREVRSDDPSLSPETNARITEELQEAVGATSVQVPRDRPRPTRGEPMSERTPITVNRVVLALSLAFVLTLAAIFALFTGSWWVLPLAAAVHAFGTMVVLTLAVRVTRAIEHPSPTVAAAMNEEGVVSADHRFSEMVEEFKAPEADTDAQWQNERSVRPQEDGATAGFQQSRSVTPTSQPSDSAPDPHMVDIFIAAMGVFFAMVSIIIPLAVGGNWLWLTPAIIIPLSAGLVAINTLTRRREGMQGFWVTRNGIVTVAAAAVIGVAVFCVLVAVFVGQPSGAQ